MEAPGVAVSLVLGTRPLDLDQVFLDEEALYLSPLAASIDAPAQEPE